MDFDTNNTSSQRSYPIPFSELEELQLQKRSIRLLTKEYEQTTEAPELPKSTEVTGCVP